MMLTSLVFGILVSTAVQTESSPAVEKTQTDRTVKLEWTVGEITPVLNKSDLVREATMVRNAHRLDPPTSAPLAARLNAEGEEVIEHAEVVE